MMAAEPARIAGLNTSRGYVATAVMWRSGLNLLRVAGQ
jgi:hypothetical protein